MIKGDTQLVGVFGWPVAHSLSPPMHNAAFEDLGMNWVYVPFAVKPENLEHSLRALPSLGIRGVNLTIPHKEHAYTLVDELTDEAKLVGGVNTVVCTEAGLLGTSTDGVGFMTSLHEAGVQVHGCDVVVVGAGGASRSIVFSLSKAGAQVKLYNRTISKAEQLAEDVESAQIGSVEVLASEKALNDSIRGARLLVHTTSVGMYPNSSEMSAIDIDSLNQGLTVYDLIYNPIETRLLQCARKRGCQTINGVKMLVYQGAEAFRLWTGRTPSTETMELAVLGNLK